MKIYEIIGGILLSGFLAGNLLTTGSANAAPAVNEINDTAVAAEGDDDERAFFDDTLSDCLGEERSGEKLEECMDKALDACTEEFQSTAGQIACIDRGYELWDRELNEAYKELLGKVTRNERKALKRSQKAWIRYRDTRYDLHGRLFEGRGTMYVPWIANARLKVVKERALELRQYSDEYQEPVS